jgi:hypothetical protein
MSVGVCPVSGLKDDPDVTETALEGNGADEVTVVAFDRSGGRLAQDPMAGVNILDFADTVVPVVTFVLGGIATHLYQQYTRRKDAIRLHAQTTADMAAEWYNQLSALYQQLCSGADYETKALGVQSYLLSRSALPKMLFSISVLKERGGSELSRLIEAAEEFLAMVTVPDYSRRSAWCAIGVGTQLGGWTGRTYGPQFRSLFREFNYRMMDSIPEHEPEMARRTLEAFLPDLDMQLQIIVREAAKFYK